MDRLSTLAIAGRVAATSEKEGAYAVTDGELVAHLQKFLAAKYAVEMAYRSYADRVRGPWRDSLVAHWSEHAGEERKSAYDLAMKVVGLGADPIQTTVQIPPCPSNLMALCQSLIGMELEAIEAGRKLAALAGENTSMRVLAENTVLLDTQHLDDLRRMLAKSDL